MEEWTDADGLDTDVTCPEALLAQPEDVYLSVCVMGQYRKTRCVPPVFPLLFSNKMVFVRTFPAGVVDPADVSEQLESDTSTFELIQMVPPEGEILATVEEGTRDFVFPGPRLTSREAAPERAIFLKSSLFPGITPMVEFATTAVIEEIDGVDGQPATPLCGLHPVRSSPTHARRSPTKTMSPPLDSKSPLRSPATPQRALGDHGNCRPSKREKEKDKMADSVLSTSLLLPGPSPPPPPPPPPPPLAPVSPRRRGSQRTRKERGQRSRPPSSEISGYQQPTVASMSRALSPYTHRRMCELSEDTRARLGHLGLGPHRFKKQTDSQPPFLVPCCSDVSVSESPSYQRASPPRASSLHHPGIALESSLLGSYRPKLTKSQSGSMRTGLSPDVQRKWRGGEGQTVTPVEAAWSIPGASSSRRPSNLGTSSFNERLHSSPHSPSQWEQIHSRVQRILQTHGTSPKQLTEEEEQQRTGGLCGGAHWGHPVSQDRSSLGEWADGIHSRKQASHGRPPRYHRAAFEESLGKIYKSMYQKAYDN
ncbi:Spermatogenesis-associated protein 6 [Merluccius polli]|uniref:Spermatogenesis-associated protein 6 n=1 Tax=Merluccius polli TaxID=89951 RepID=A0AA47MRJ9_MERPO|nr:Spermatogenesis-associated protein 6 [Merluccius polli]